MNEGIAWWEEIDGDVIERAGFVFAKVQGQWKRAGKIAECWFIKTAEKPNEMLHKPPAWCFNDRVLDFVEGRGVTMLRAISYDRKVYECSLEKLRAKKICRGNAGDSQSCLPLSYWELVDDKSTSVIGQREEHKPMKTPESITTKAHEASTLLKEGAGSVQQYLTKLYAEEARDDLTDERKKMLSGSRAILEEWQARFLVCESILKGGAVAVYSHTGEIQVKFKKIPAAFGDRG